MSRAQISPVLQKPARNPKQRVFTGSAEQNRLVFVYRLRSSGPGVPRLPLAVQSLMSLISAPVELKVFAISFGQRPMSVYHLGPANQYMQTNDGNVVWCGHTFGQRN